MKNPLISVILPTYNRADLISNTIDSVLNQTYKNFEIVIVDDGSMDNTREIVSDYMEKCDKIIYEKTEKQGVSNARNKAFSLANGDYYFFLDSDDCIHPKLFEYIVEAISKTGAKMASEYFCQTNNKTMKEVLDSASKQETQNDFVYRNSEETVFDYFHKSPIDMIGGLLVNKDFAKGVLFDSRFIIGEDKLYIYECIKRNADYVIIPKKWYFNRIHTSSASANFSRTAFLSRYMRRKVVFLNELKLGRKDNAVLQINQAFHFALEHFMRNKTIKEFAFFSNIIRKDRKYFKLLDYKKFRIFAFLLSYFNPFVFFEKNAQELKIWKDSGLF